MIRSVILMTLAMAAAVPQAETSQAPSNPPAVQRQSASVVPSFFEPKTKDDIMALAKVDVGEPSDAASNHSAQRER